MSSSSLLIVLLLVCYGGASIFTGMTGQLGRALSRLASTGPQPYRLLPGLILTPTSRWNLTRTTTVQQHPNRGRTLIDTVTNVLRTHRLMWKVAPGLQVSLFADDKGMIKVEAGRDNEVQDSSRTFGMMRRMKLALLPIMFKLGVITTLLVLLTTFALKGLTIGVILIIMASVGLLSKLHISYKAQEPHKEVHVHMHGGAHGGGGLHHYWDHNSWDNPWDHNPWDRLASGNHPTHQPSASPWAQYIS